MRVIAGTRGGRRLTAPPGRDTRPTSDRVREALFSSLGERVAGARVLDLYAGSGALGVEALSRGALSAVFVERDPRAVGVVERNLRELDLHDHAAVHSRDAAAFCRAPEGGPFEVVLCDPPYTEPVSEVWRCLEALQVNGALARAGTVVVERDRRRSDPTPPPPWLATDRSRSYGDTVLVHLHWQHDSPRTNL